jgi:hypothetical protein
VQRAVVAGVLSALIVGSAGVGIGVVVTRLDPPDSLVGPPEAGTIAVVPERFADARSVELRLEHVPGVPLIGRASGTVTGSRCVAGGRIRSGTSPWSVDGRPLLALSTPTPLYRDLASGDEGTDVASLQAELRRLGLDAPATATYDAATAGAVRDMWEGVAPHLTDQQLLDGGLPLSRVVWLPAPSVSPAECAAVLGGVVAAGSPVATTAATITEAVVDPLPDDLVPGARVLDVQGLAVHVPTSGSVSGRTSLRKLLSTELGIIAVKTLDQERPVPLSGTLSLTKPLRTATLPASALVSGSGSCVLDAAGAPHGVVVVSSTLGRSIVSFEDRGSPARVQISPPGSASCS